MLFGGVCDIRVLSSAYRGGMSVVVFQYVLKKYARWRLDSSEKGTLEEIDGQDLRLTLYNSHYLVVSQQSVVQENVCLLSSRDRVQVLWHEDNLQIHVKLQDHMHKFRIKFAPDDSGTGRDNCVKCCNVLTTYVNIKDIGKSSNPSSSRDNPSKSNLISPVHGIVSMTQMANIIGGNEVSILPLAYQQLLHPEVDKEYLSSVINLCLSDSSFPSFVAQVEMALKEMSTPNSVKL